MVKSLKKGKRQANKGLCWRTANSNGPATTYCQGRSDRLRHELNAWTDRVSKVVLVFFFFRFALFSLCIWW